MNVQRRPRCTFILSPDPVRVEKTLKWRHRPGGAPKMNVQHRPGRWGLVGEVARGASANGIRPGLRLAQERQPAKLR